MESANHVVSRSPSHSPSPSADLASAPGHWQEHGEEEEVNALTPEEMRPAHEPDLTLT